jgi:hypothetical protein
MTESRRWIRRQALSKQVERAMTVADIKGRKEVLDAIAEFDRLGRARFLEKYKFGPSRSCTSGQTIRLQGHHRRSPLCATNRSMRNFVG